jgi:hypothetical protein
MSADHSLALDADDAHRTARRLALASVFDELNHIKLLAKQENAVIPVTRAGWRTVLEDSHIAELAMKLLHELSRIPDLDVNDSRVIGTELRTTLLQAVSTLRNLMEAAENVSWFMAPDTREEDLAAVRQAATTGCEVLEAVLDALCTNDPASASAVGAGERLRSLAARLESDPLGEADASDEDAVALVFGTGERPFTDRRGIVCAGRIRAAYAGRDAELAAISHRLLRALLPDSSAAPPDAATYAASLALSDRPLICHQVARHTLELLRTRFAEQGVATAAAVGRLGGRIRHSASSHFDGLAPTAVRLRGTDNASERARLLLELYRLASEGQLRHTAWAVLELRGHERSSIPMLGELRDLLLAERSALTDLLAKAIHPEWRNAAAHEEHHWDAVSERLVLAEGRAVSPHEIEDATGYAMSVIYGFETGIACARLQIPDLARALDEPAGRPQDPALLDLEIRRAFGGHGVWVWDTVWKRKGIEIVLEADLDGELHRILAAVLMAHLLSGSIDGWRIRVRDGDQSIAVGREALEAATALLSSDFQDSRIDVNVILPLVASAKRLAGIPEVTAAREITRLALKHPLGFAQDKASAILRLEPGSVARFATTLDMAARALEAGWRVLGGNANQEGLLADLRSAREAAIGWGRGDRTHFRRLEHYVNRLLDAYHSLPEAPLLPGLSQA